MFLPIFAPELPTSLSRYWAIGNEESPDNVEQPHHLTGGISNAQAEERQRVSQKITACWLLVIGYWLSVYWFAPITNNQYTNNQYPTSKGENVR